MSNVQSGTAIITSHVATAAPAKAVYTPARVLKMDLDGALSRRIVSAVAAAEGTNGATETTANISGRALRMGLKDYAAMAGRISEDSVAGAIVFAVVNYLNGRASLAELAGKNVPAWLGTRVAEAFSSTKPTNSCDEAQLRTYAGLIAHGIKAAVKPAAPKAPSPAAAATSTAAVTPAPAATPAGLTPAELREAVAMLGGALDNGAATSAEKAINAYEIRMELKAKAAAEREANNAAFAAAQVAEFAKREATVHAKACAFAELASFFGIKLSKAQLAKLDAAEAKEKAAA